MSTLVQEIGKLIAGQLLTEQDLHLPEQCSIHVRRVAARRLSSRLVEPPHRVVEITFTPSGVSLVELIRQAARCSEEQALDAYRRWLAKSRNEQGEISIEGVGSIRHKHFTPDPTFEQRLNPQGHTPQRIKRPMPWWAWSSITLLIIFALFGGLTLLVDPLEVWNRYQKSRTPQVEETTPTLEVQAEAVTESEAESVVPATPTPEPTATPESATTTPEVKPVATHPTPQSTTTEGLTWPRTRLGMNYVVLGIFSTEQNARRAIDQAIKKYALQEGEASIFLYGEKLLVALGEWETRPEAKEVAARYRTEKGIADVWVYSKQ